MIVNESMKQHLINFLKQNIRFDKRKLNECREIKIETDIIPTAEGSSRVKIGESEAIAGVKLSVEQAYPDTPESGNLMVEVGLEPMASPGFESGPPTIEGIEYSRIVDRGIREGKVVDLDKLCITPGEKVWSVMIDVSIINNDGNLIDLASIAALAALYNTRLPKLTETGIDYKEKTKEKLPLKNVIVTTTIAKIRDYFIVDPNDFEWSLIDARLTVTRTKDGRICALQKGGEEPIKKEDLEKMLSLSKKVFDKNLKIIEGALK